MLRFKGLRVSGFFGFRVWGSGCKVLGFRAYFRDVSLTTPKQNPKA